MNEREQLEELILRLTDLVSRNQQLLEQTSELLSKSLQVLEMVRRTAKEGESSKGKAEENDLEFYMGL